MVVKPLRKWWMSLKYVLSKVGSIATFFPYFWVTTGLFWLPKGTSYMGIICFTGAFFVVLKYQVISLIKNVKSDRFLWILFVCFIYACFSYEYHGYSSRELKALFFAFIFLLVFSKGGLPLRYFIVFVLCGALGVVVTAASQYFLMNVDRIQGFINPITYAVFAGLCSMITFSYALAVKNRIGKTCLLILGGGVIAAVILTGSRGVLLAVLIALAILGVSHINLFVKIRKSHLISSVALVLLVLTIIFPSIQKRFQDTQSELSVIKEGRLGTSIGVRLQLWESAYYSLDKKPLFGFGDGYSDEFKRQHKEGLISEYLWKRNPPHYHNQYIDKYIKSGLLGLILLLLLLGYPLYVALRSTGKSFPKVCIISIVCIVAFSSLTDVPLNHAPIIYCYFFIMSYLLHLLKNPEKSDETSGM